MKDKQEDSGKISKGITLVVRMPGKGVFESIKNVQQMDENNPDIEETEGIYNLLSEILSNNMAKKKITVEELEDYDIEECSQIVMAYMDFVNELKNDPN